MAVLGILPYMLAVYLFINEGFSVTETVLAMAALVLVFHLSGYHALLGFAERLERLVKHTKTASGNFEPTLIPVDDGYPEELTDLIKHFNNVADSLKMERGRNEEVMTRLMHMVRDTAEQHRQEIADNVEKRERLTPYIGNRIVDQLLESGSGEALQPEYRTVTVLFADIRGFTSIAEHERPETIIQMLNEYFEAMVEVIYRNQGVVDKFIGDEIMAIFGLLGETKDAPGDAIRAAVEMRSVTHQLMQKRAKYGKRIFETGIGINSGEVVAGNLGSRHRMDYTIIGDAVNVASRLEKIALGNEIVISEATYKECQHLVDVRHRGEVTVKNRKFPVSCYEVVRPLSELGVNEPK